MEVLITFKFVTGGGGFSISVDKDSTIESMRAAVSTKLGGAPLASFRLLYAGKVLKDEETLATHDLPNGDFVGVSVRV